MVVPALKITSLRVVYLQIVQSTDIYRQNIIRSAALSDVMALQ